MSETDKQKLEKLRQDIADIGKLRPVKVLVVDDDETFCLLIQDLLAKYKLVVDVVNCGPEALRRIEQTTYDVVLLDIKMPCMDGMTVRRAIKSSCPSTQVVFCTGHPEWPGLSDALAEGCVHIIGKNFLDKSLSDIFDPLCTKTP